MRAAALDTITELARRDPRVVFIGSDLGAGAMEDFRKEMPDRFFMEGVAEQNIIGMAAGLAMDGFIPFVNTIATFLTRRCYEQVALDLCLHNLPVRLIANGGGLVYSHLGPTHQAIEDIAIMRALPNMTVVAPSDAHEMRKVVKASVAYPGPMYIRVGSSAPVISRGEEDFAIGRAIVKRTRGRMGFISTGIMTERCLAAGDILLPDGVDPRVLHCHTVKPLDVSAVRNFARNVDALVTVEEHSRIGGLGSAVADAINGLVPLLRLAIPDAFCAWYGTHDELLESIGLTPQRIAGHVHHWLLEKKDRQALVHR